MSKIITLNQWNDYYFNNFKIHKLKESSAIVYTNFYNYNIRNSEIVDKDVNTITNLDIQKLLNESVKVKEKVFGILKELFNSLLSEGYIKKNPLTLIFVKKSIKVKKFKLLSFADEDRLIKEMENDNHKNLATFLLNTGLRIGESLGLQRGDIDFENNKISIVRQVNSTTKKFLI